MELQTCTLHLSDDGCFLCEAAREAPARPPTTRAAADPQSDRIRAAVKKWSRQVKFKLERNVAQVT